MASQRNSGPRASVLLALALLFVLGTAFAQDGQTGTLSGQVREAETGKPIAWADVLIQGTTIGGISQQNGTFTIYKIPAGTYTVTVQMMGYTPRKFEGVAVVPGQVTNLIAELSETAVQMETIRIGADEKMDVTEQTRTEYKIDKEEFKIRAINTVTDALAKQPGVTIDGQGRLHVRGGRADEVKYFVDGMPVTDPFVGQNTLDVSFASLENIQLLSGGFDAEFGNAQSGIVNIQTAEGGRKFSGLVKYMTDDYGAPDKTYWNADDIAFAVGGPLVSKDLRFHLSAEANFSDTYIKPRKEYTKREVYGITLQDRIYNQYRGQGKLTYYFSPEMKLSTEALYTRSLQDQYHHPYSRVGWWSAEAKRWWYEPLDTTYVFYSGPEHLPRFITEDSQAKASWTHTLSPETFYTLKVSRFTTSYLERVGHKEPREYIPTYRSDEYVDPANRYFVVQGDYPHYQDYRTRRYTVRSDLTSQVTERHRMKTGLELDYYDLSMFEATYPDSNRPEGPWPDRYNVFSWGGAAYIQDKLQYEGMVLSAGLRLDFFDPGARAARIGNEFLASTFQTPQDISLWSRLKKQVSPRLGMAYPISDRDVLHFHYGRFYQLPVFERMYKGIGQQIEQDGGTYGNIFLDPEKNISYELGVDHQLTKTLNLDMTVFFKDIFGWIDTDEIVNGSLASFGNSAPIGYVNQAYGTVKGLEFKLNRRLANKFGGSIVYTLARATGTFSDDNSQALVGTGVLNRKPLTENPLNWDRTHAVVGNLILTDPGVWEFSMDYMYETGSPFTPRRYQQRSIDAEDMNSARLPDESRLDVRANKLYSIYGQEFRLFVEANNVLNRENIRDLSPGEWPSNSGLYTVYYTETGQLGGAYNLNDVNASAGNQYVSLGDPRVLDPMRRVKVGIMFDW
ncbi:MAG: TonB-dependent receptor [Candidatus Eisenbacteria bacterium]|nr:TonB-dependent receptor [Candidatus Eisenbacteria bacterium]